MRRFALFVAVVFAILLGLVLTWRLFNIVLLFVASLAVAATLRAPIERLMDRGVPRGLAIIAVYLLVGVLAAGLLYFLYVRLGTELATLTEDLSYLYSRLSLSLGGLSRYSSGITTRFPTPEEMTALLAGGQLANVAQPLMGIGQNLANIFSNLGLVIILSVYWTADHLRFERLALSLVPAPKRAAARNIWRSIEVGLGRYMRSELLQSLLAGVLLAPAFWLLGVRYPVFWALIASLAWFVPLVGALIVIVPMWVVVWVQSGPAVASLAVAVTLVILAVLEFVLERRMYARERGTHVLLLVVMLVMADAYGILGLLLAPPIAQAIHILLTELASPEGAVSAQPGIEDTVDALEGELNQVRGLVAASSNGNSKRLDNLAERLKALLEEAKNVAGV